MSPQKRSLQGKLVYVTLRVPRWLDEQIEHEVENCPDGMRKKMLWIASACAEKLRKTLEEVNARNAEVYPDD
jgi:hypothetical protein